ncbi:MAG: thiol reductant ABC exporter subunit CydD, partial [Phyllobacteriaceae bacterium]|nr:thiol reductant ABC exporter subunit CydD [Phyllobacteriaceae bacterium]
MISSASPNRSARTRLLASLAPVVGWRAAGTSAAAAVGGVAAVGFAGVLARTVDVVVFRGAGVDDLVAPLTLLAAVGGVRAVATWGADRLGFEAAARVRRHLFARLLTRVAEIGPVRLADREHDDSVATLTEAVDGVAPLWRSWIPAATRAAVVPLVVLAVVGFADPLAA